MIKIINEYKTFSKYGITSEEDLLVLPDTLIDLILNEIITEIPNLPYNIFRLNKDNLERFDIATKVEFLKNVELYRKEEKDLLENLNVLSELEDFDIVLKASNSFNNTDVLRKDYGKNILYDNLFDFQKDTFNKFKENKHIIIAETGTGKTITALAIAEQLWLERKISGVIVILANDENIFLQELEKHLPQYMHGKYRVMTYYNMQKKLDNIIGLSNYLFILDEVHYLKNISARSSFVKSLDMNYMLGLTATVFDKTTDIPILFDNLGLEYGYDDIMIKMESDKSIDIDIIEKPLTLTNGEKELVNTIALSAKSVLDEQHKVIQMLSMRGERIAELLELIERHKNDKIIIFTNYIETADKLNYMIKDSLLLKGGGSKDVVQSKLRSFLHGKFNILITTSILNQSYNLQKANVIILYDFDYNSIKAQQTEGRIKRIGQEKKCYIYYMYHKDTIEEKIFQAIFKKRTDYIEMLERIK